ncbi:PREDICTED: dipeptidase 1-like [Polistes dominula]|uniref:Dipeptidase n=1 Tax=Polistes dominula TaxID=743375 RepID=A0ABM1IF58_POLDO|nr:PREDICTED: dipeptidase 1-like [Polistes dominula]XP_015178845.1 PREDICTED: dipeptidase 1-like [Polistes dominula]
MTSGGQSGVWIVSVIILSIGSWVGRVGPQPADNDLVSSLTTPRERLEVVRQILTEVPLIDGHNDLPWNIRNFVHNQLADFDFDKDLRQVPPWSKSNWSQTDLVRLRQGMVGGQFWAAYVPCDSQHLNAVQLTLEQVDLIKRLIEKYSQQMQFAASSEEILEAHERGRIASLIGVEGGHSLGSSLAVLRTLYHLGVRYLTLTHRCNTPWAKSSTAEEDDKDGGGLTAFGKAVVREMNRLGMLIDLSHTARATMKDALKATKAPLIFSHSSAFAICNSSRNVPDDILKQLAANGGLVMVTFYNYFVKCGPEATISDVAEHIYYIKNLIGVDHIGVGGDFDGINKTPRGLNDVSKYPDLFIELIRSGKWSVLDLKKVAGLNLLRVFKKVERVRDDMRTAGVTPSEEYLQNSPDVNGKCALDTNTVQRGVEV